ncbi:MAG TPA: hypothetical protein VE753_07040 [Gaiellaceae bacterium]|nr:hypothetical protein [Gaiellaceae bacterium]
MDDEHLRAALDRLVPPPEGSRGWDDVLRRAERKRRRRRRRRGAGLAVAAAAAVLVAALAAAGQIGLPVSRSHAPHLLLRGTFAAPGGARAGAIELEVQRAMVAFGRRVVVQPFPSPRRRGQAPATFSVRWFLSLEAHGRLADVSLAMRGPGGWISTLCGPCRAEESGELDLSMPQAAALLNDEVSFALVRHGRRAATASVALVRSHLRRGLACWGDPATRLHCRRIYFGRP